MSDKDNTEIVENEFLDNDDEDLNESAASDTLKPNPTRSEMLATFTSLLAQLGKEDLSHFFNDSIKKYSADGVPSATAPGKTGLGQMSMPTLNAVKEDVAEVFAGENLTEEAQEKFTTIFEAAVNARANLIEGQLVEEYEARLEEEVADIQEAMTEKLDQYLDYVVEQWIEENKLAIDTSLRADIAEDFMEGLYNLFAESYISVPEQKIDVLGELKTQVEELESALDESINRQLELQNVIDEATMEATFDEVSEGLAITQVEKFRTLSEGIEYSDAETYRKKLEVIKDKFFSEKRETATGVITEEADEGLERPAPRVSGDMAHYVRAISQTNK